MDRTSRAICARKAAFALREPSFRTALTLHPSDPFSTRTNDSIRLQALDTLFIHDDSFLSLNIFQRVYSSPISLSCLFARTNNELFNVRFHCHFIVMAFINLRPRDIVSLSASIFTNWFCVNRCIYFSSTIGHLNHSISSEFIFVV